MALTLADLQEWDPEAIEELSQAAAARARTSREKAQELPHLGVYQSWEGRSGEAAHEAIQKVSTRLEISAQTAVGVALGAQKVHGEAVAIKAQLAALFEYAEQRPTVYINTRTNTVEPPKTAGWADEELAAIHAKIDDTAGRITLLLGQAEAVDAELAGLLNAATGTADGAPAGATPPVPPQLPDDPKSLHDAWAKLTPQEKDAEYQHDHYIGNRGGIPFADRDIYNRKRFTELQRENDSELARLRAAHPDWADGKNTAWRIPPKEYTDWKAHLDSANHTRDGFQAVEKSLTSSDGVPRYLSFIDDQGHAAVSIGNPDTAKRTATFVPGTGQDLAAFGGSNVKSEKMFNAALQADRTLSKSDVAVTTWMGYDRPMNLVEAASPGRANSGGAALDSYLDGMHASHVGPGAIDTVIGHSYGSTLVGGAATGGHHLAADNVIAVGSPGMLADHASELSLEAGAHVFASRAENDVIGVVTYATLGPDPMARQFGGIPFEAAAGPSSPLGLPSVAAHSSYWDQGNPALTNMGRIIAGQLNVTPPTFTP